MVTMAVHTEGINELKEKSAPSSWVKKMNLGLSPVICSSPAMWQFGVPIDGAPKGRLILPQVQTLRDLLDHNILALVVKENQLANMLEKLACPPDLVITDSQVVNEVSAALPPDIPLTTFSTLFARFKSRGLFCALLEGVKKIEQLEDGARILIAEACTHHAMADDIGRVKLPRWLREYTGKRLDFEVAAGPALKRDLRQYDMVIQCGGCMLTPTVYQNRVREASSLGVAISNYGLVISYRSAAAHHQSLPGIAGSVAE